MAGVVQPVSPINNGPAVENIVDGGGRCGRQMLFGDIRGHIVAFLPPAKSGGDAENDSRSAKKQFLKIHSNNYNFFCDYCSGLPVRGRRMEKVVPTPGVEALTYMRPWWYCSMMRFASASPSPQPRRLVVYPGLKTVLKFLRGMPRPVSATSTTTSPWSPGRQATLIAPCPSIASTAFLIKFSITHSSNGAHALTGMDTGAYSAVRLIRPLTRVAI